MNKSHLYYFIYYIFKKKFYLFLYMFLGKEYETK